MAFNGYPMYSNAFQPPYQDRLSQLQNSYQNAIPQAPAQPVNQGLLCVQGEAGAKSYLVAPNSTVLLMDSETQRFYLKSTDGSGMPNLRVFEYAEVSPNSAPQSTANLDDKYVTREEYDGLKSQCDQILNKLNMFLSPVVPEKPSRKSKEVITDE